MKKTREIKPENISNYLMGIITESGTILIIMFAAFVLGAILLFILRG